jgi:DNA-binding protein Fis
MPKARGSVNGSIRSAAKLTECCFITLRGLEYLHAQRVLEMCGGNRAKAAKVLGIERTALRRYLGSAGLR